MHRDGRSVAGLLRLPAETLDDPIRIKSVLSQAEHTSSLGPVLPKLNFTLC
jgi:hypothetical protein